MKTGNPFTRRLVIEPKPQTIWGIPHTIWFFAMGVGGALYINRFLFGFDLARVLGLSLADVLSLALIGIGGLVLIADLGRPLRFLRALSNPKRSWISVGAICDFLFMGVETLYVLPDLTLAGTRPLAMLPWATTPWLGLAMQIVAAVSALVVIVYPGFVLAYSPSIPFWNTTLVPLQFLGYAFASACGLAFVAAALGGAPLGGNDRWLLVASLAIVMGLFVVHLLNASFARGTARLSAQELLRGRLAGTFVWGTLIVGLGAPVVLTLLAVGLGDASTAAALLLIAGLLTIPGNLFSKYSVIKAGIYSPLI